MTDSQLLTQFVSAHDPHAFGELVRRYERLVWSTCRRVLTNRCDVEDAFQTTFLLLATKAHRIRKPESLSNWIYSVAWKTASRLRKRRVFESLEHLDEFPDQGETPLESLARQYEIDLVDQQIQMMHEQHRTPLVLFYFAGMTANQIADQLNISLTAVEGRLRRARNKLRLELQSTGIQASPVIVVGLLATKFVPRPELVAATTDRCVATGAGTIAGATTGSISTGAKLMIVKTLCVAGATVVMALVGYMHAGSVNSEPDQPAVASVVTLDVQSSEQEDAVEITTVDEPSETTSDLTPVEAFHDHLMDAHSHIGLHVEKFFEMLGN